ncbi:MAG: isoleucine--tRNA ligase, partial [Rhodovibrionaceae bacterium]|nr:isoleucine--tRNA ligase [Rhodovibrionaceae bacterium]
YHEHKSPTIWVRFPVVEAAHPSLEGASVVIWTTTPWTIPGNRAVACHAEETYAVVRLNEPVEGSRVEAGECVVVAKALLEQFLQDAKVESHEVLAELKGDEMTGTLLAHPFRGHSEADGGYAFEVPVYEAEFVTMDQGTGFVHIAPGHGADDYALGRAKGLEIPQTVDGDGVFMDHVPLVAGKTVYTQDGKDGDANGAIIKALADSGRLLAKGSLRHSYPHSWRSKAPLIFRNTPQWFISMEANGLRDKALKAIDETRFVPAAGKTRLRAMIENRPDWCVSRQRLWGVPLPLFVHKRSGEPLQDQAVIDRVAEAFEQEGGDAWFTSPASRFLGNDYDPEDFEQATDVVEVWFDSGSTHAYVLEARPELQWPASLYLEGSDQHRGWFHTSLLESAGTRGRAPFEAVLTHGFALDEKGLKMSKSLGNVTAPQDIMEQNGADILRLWVASSDYAEDIRIGKEIVKHQVDAYRRFRNTLRYLLGALSDFEESEKVPAAEMPELERWVLHRLAQLDGIVRRGVEAFDFNDIYVALHTFCAVDLSAFYFDVRKDSLYCDRADSPRRRACRTVMDTVFDCLTSWLAPILCFTAEEAWLHRGKQPESVHMRLFPEVPAEWRDDALASKWEKVRRVRRVVTGALELERAEKRIGASLQAHPTVYVAEPALYEAVRDVDLAEVVITSGTTLLNEEPPQDAYRLEEVPGVGVVSDVARGERCGRCWKVLEEVGEDSRAPGTCSRCADAVVNLGLAAE